MQRSYEVNELVRTLKFLQYLPQHRSLDCTKCLDEIDETLIKVHVLLNAFLFNLTGREDHVTGTSFCAWKLHGDSGKTY